MKKLNIFIAVAAALFLGACSSEELPLTQADGYGEIKFSIGNEGTRADITYIAYDYDRDPHTMSVYGWHDLGSATFDNADNKIFYNTEVTASILEPKGVVWEYNPKKYWFDYAAYNSFDFFGCMPYNENTTLTSPESNSYTMTMPVDFDDDYEVFSPEETALLCHEPINRTIAEGVIPFRMDQTLSAYKLLFQLGDNMDNIRDFIIKGVKIYGEGLATSGTVSRTYTWDAVKESWETGDITWSGVATTDVTKENAYSIPYRNNASLNEEWEAFYTDKLDAEERIVPGQGTLRVTNTAVQWGNPVYIIAVDGSTPKFEVIYDVVVTDEEGKDIITRPNVHSVIEFTNENFGERTTGVMGMTQPITVKIVPDHLYVLADADQTFGWITLQ